MRVKKQTYKYQGCNEVYGQLTTTSRCTADAKIGFQRASQTGKLIDEMLKAYKERFLELGYDFNTIKFQISLLDTPSV